MAAISELLNTWKASKNIETDMAAAQRLGVTRAAVSNWRRGARQPDDTQLAKLCKETGEDFGTWRVTLDAERAPNESARESLERALRLLKKYGRAAAIVLVLTGAGAHTNPAHAGNVYSPHNPLKAVYYVKL